MDDAALLAHIRATLRETRDDWNYVTPRQFYEGYVQPRKSYVLLDVRRPADFAKGHIVGARSVFWLDLFRADVLASLPRDAPVFVVCYVGHTASQAVALLRLLGVPAVGLKYGYGVSPQRGVPVAGWVPHAYPLVRE